MGFRTVTRTSVPTKKEISVSLRNQIYVIQPVSNNRYNTFSFIFKNQARNTIV
jgi:hypothetical protein